ncbi:MAG: Cu(I)-responsive transcriptional regulator [Rhodospirillaceae bacterium]|nr:Cu(I)-responsive transcriptional regulator [Rhodospirillaceae bacterium]|tara:strand:- start:3804 stop:4196 length:393 start_codon:yes stop_codon:yes gene_type:complete
MRISSAAKKCGLPVKTVRYYDEITLVKPSNILENGYRDYNETDVKKLIFISKSRQFGFPINQCRELLSLYEDTNRASSDVRKIAKKHIDGINDKLTKLKSLKFELMHLVNTCNGDDRPSCPILDKLSGDH